MKLIIAAILLTSCGIPVKVKGGTTNRLITEGETKVTFAVDFSSCQKFISEEAQNKCLDLMIDMLSALKDLEATDNASPTE